MMKLLNKLKEEIFSHRVLAHYDVQAKTKISANTSSYGVGAVLLRSKDGTTWQPVAFTSRALSETESRYAQIEKEALASFSIVLLFDKVKVFFGTT